MCKSIPEFLVHSHDQFHFIALSWKKVNENFIPSFATNLSLQNNQEDR